MCIWSARADDNACQRLRVLGNRVLKRIFQHKRDEMKRGWRHLHNVEFSLSVLLARYY
jgi:hypothetical protein